MVPSQGSRLLLSELWCLLKEEVFYSVSRGAFSRKKVLIQGVEVPSEGRSLLLSELGCLLKE